MSIRTCLFVLCCDNIVYSECMCVYIQCKGNIIMEVKYSLEDTVVLFPLVVYQFIMCCC